MTKTINGLTAVTSAAAGDYIPIWRASNGDTRKITKANLLGATFSGGGTIVNNGFTLTVPATGTAMLLGTSQTVTGAKTFSAALALTNGLTFDGVAFDYLTANTWGVSGPAITGAGSTPSPLSYTTQTGIYSRMGNVVFYYIALVIETITGGTGDLRISLPIAATTVSPAPVSWQTIDVSDTAASVTFRTVAGQAYGIIVNNNDNASASVQAVTTLSAGDSIFIQGAYFV